MNDAGNDQGIDRILPTDTGNHKSVDWNLQASEAVTATVGKAVREETRKCDPAEKPDSFLLPCKRKKQNKFEWAEPRAGFSGGLPYVKVGEHCAIGLGFFGCGFGGDPPANSDLFEEMDDPERDRSSVPTPEEDRRP